MDVPPSPPGADQAYAGYLAQILVGPMADYLPLPAASQKVDTVKYQRNFLTKLVPFTNNVSTKMFCKKGPVLAFPETKKRTFLAFPETKKELF
jgi:hypothetical protein